MNANSAENQKIKGKFVNEHVLACQSMVVEELLYQEVISYDEIQNFYAYQSYDGPIGQQEYDELVEKLEEDLDNLSDQISDYENEIEELEEQLDEAEDEYNDLLAEMEEEAAEKMLDKISDIKGSIELKKEEMTDYQKDHSKLDGELDDLKALELEPLDIYEWWLVDDSLGRWLQEEGEPVLEAMGSTWWGRSTSGQAILLDGIISRLCRRFGLLVETKGEEVWTTS